MKLKLTTEYGERKEFITDEKIFNGLYITNTLKNIKRNSKVFRIEAQLGKAKCTFLNSYNIITIVESSTDKVQLLITSKIELEQLDFFSDLLIPPSTKELTIKCSKFNITTGKLSDLL